ncbi:MAG: uroporphyrinogen decarboxylase family protein [Caldicoprobacterales bacterium]|jgi:uroporphyrinogen decarboxylase
MYPIKKYVFEPNYNNMIKAAANHWVDRIPLYEHIIDAKVINEITGNKPHDLFYSKDESESLEGFRQYWDFWKQMGYDTASMEFSVCKALIGSGALYEHKEGCIKDRQDFERYPWDEIPERFFDMYAPYIRNFEKTCPPGMKAVGGVGNGVFEAVQDIVGYVNLCYIKSDDEELFADIFNAMGKVHYRIWNRFMDEFSDVYCVLRFGDDLGFKSSTLLSEDDIRTHILPQYRRITDKVHSKGKPFLLHSCGNLFNVFDDIIDIANIDAKHSNEDEIAHFTVWVEKYGDKIANFGGIDTDVLCRHTPEYIREYVIDCLDRVKGHGGIAFGTGNSIPDYVPTEGYLAMVEAVREWRQDQEMN